MFEFQNIRESQLTQWNSSDAKLWSKNPKELAIALEEILSGKDTVICDIKGKKFVLHKSDFPNEAILNITDIVNKELIPLNTDMEIIAQSEHCDKLFHLLEDFSHTLRNREYEDSELIIALKSKNDDMANILISQGVDINKVDKNGITPLLYAAMADKPDLVLEILKQNPNINGVNQNGDSILTIAAKNGWDEIIEVLSNNNETNWNHVNKQGENALHQAVLMENESTVKILINLEPKLITASDNNGTTPFISNCDRGEANINRIFVDSGHITEDELYKGASICCQQGFEALLEVFDLSESQKNDLLIVACNNRQENISRFLIENNADPCYVSAEGDSAFSEAAKMGMIDSVNLMLDNGVNLDMVDRLNILDQVLGTDVEARSSGNDDVCSRLIELGATVTADHFFKMCSKNYLTAAEQALLINTDLKDQIDSNGDTPLIHASRNDRNDLVDLLCNNGVDINHTNHNNLSAFTLSLSSYNLNAALRLINEKNLNMDSYSGISLLELSLALMQNVSGTNDPQWPLMHEIIGNLLNKSSPDEVFQMIESLKLDQNDKVILKSLYQEKQSLLEGEKTLNLLIEGSKEISTRKLAAIVFEEIEIDLISSAQKTIEDFGDSKYYNNIISPEQYQKLVFARIEGSTTLSSQYEYLIDSANYMGSGKESIHIQKWKECDDLIKKLALEKKDIDVAFLCEINNLLRPGKQKPGEAFPGELRTKGDEVRAGNLQTRSYVLGELVATQVDEFITWLREAMNNCDKNVENPIIVASRANQWLVSIHPFSDANGRTSRMVMDYVLQRYGLPPASVGDNVENGIFPLNHDRSNANDSVKMTIDGIMRSIQILKP